MIYPITFTTKNNHFTTSLLIFTLYIRLNIRVIFMKFAICDDEKEIRNDISEKIKLFYPESSIALFENAEGLLNCKAWADIIFLDISLPDGNGIELAGELRKNGCRSVIIFVTAYEDYVFKAFDVGAFHYLLKPLSSAKLYDVLNKAVSSLEYSTDSRQEDKFIVIKSGGVSRKIAISEIVYAEVFNRKIIISTLNDKIEFYGKLSELENELGSTFFRTHRAYLINLRYLERYSATDVTLETRETLLLSKQKYQELVKSYLSYIKGADKGEF